MKSERVRAVAEGAAGAVRRFPEAAICAALSAVAAIVLIEEQDAGRWWGLLRTGTLGIPLFLAATLFAERGSSRRRGRVQMPPAWTARAAAAAILVLLYLLFDRWAYLNVPQRYIHLAATFHLLVAAAPCVRKREAYGFWHFNRRLLFRFVLATIYGGAIFVGLVLALAALDNLFGVEIPDLHYLRLLFLVGLLFHPLFFLAGIPRDFAALDADRFNPPGLRLFSQYVMLPLVALYVGILTAYLGKVLATGVWPSGWIGYLVSGLAGAGILSLLMVHPDRLARGREWIDSYARAFWIAILPSAAMVLVALWQRVEQYGMTERRYFLGVLALWLAAGAVVAAVTGTRRIRWIPRSLALLGVVISVGPWSAYTVAERSQARRLEAILAAHGALAEARDDAEPVELPFEDWEQAEAVATYMVQHHGDGRIRGFYAAPLDAALDTLSMPAGLHARVAGIMEALGVRSGPGGHPLQLRAWGPRLPLSAVGFGLLMVPGDDGEDDRMLLGGDTLRFVLGENGRAISMRLGEEVVARGSLDAVIAAAARLRRETPRAEVVRLEGVETERRDLPAGELVVELAGEEFAARLALATLTLATRIPATLSPATVDSATVDADTPTSAAPAPGDGPGELAATGFTLDAALLRAPEPPP